MVFIWTASGLNTICGNAMINWNDCTPLTREEFAAFIEAAIPFLKGMENKNNWDFFVNNTSIKWFCERFFMEALKLNGYKDYYKHNQKAKDVLAVYDLLAEEDWSEENKTRRANKESKIWDIVLNKVNKIADEVTI